jgi:broad specificity phosphatase PhoE
MSERLHILLVRHSESEANREDRLMSESGDPPLTERGREDAEKLAQWWAKVPVVALYSSPLRRARETAQAFQQVHACSLEIDERLHEIRLGAFDGRRIGELEQTEADRYWRWKTDPESPPDGGERLSEVAARMSAFLEAVAARHRAGWVIALTHADCLKAVTLHTLRAPWQSAHHLHYENMAGVLLVRQENVFQLVGLPTVLM